MVPKAVPLEEEVVLREGSPDTFCAALELARIYHPGRLRERMGVEPLLEEGDPMPAPC